MSDGDEVADEWQEDLAAADAAADALWQEALAAAQEQGIDSATLEHEFLEWAGFPSTDAAAGELRAFIDRDTGAQSEHAPAAPDQELVIYPGNDPSDWVRVSGTALTQTIDVRLAMRRGQLRIIGIRVDNDEEVTADFLREIRLGRIVEEVLAWGDPGPEPDLSGVKFKHRMSVLLDWATPGIFLQQIPAIEADETTSAKRGTPPPDSALRNFAWVYLERLRTRPHGAMAAAAREVHIARSTAYRWAELCRERGYLPQKGVHDD